MPTDIKQTIGASTEKVEAKAKEYLDKFSPYYTQQEPFNRGLVLLAGIGLVIIAIYLLTASSDKDKSSLKKEKAEREVEERLLRKLEFFKKLKE